MTKPTSVGKALSTEAIDNLVKQQDKHDKLLVIHKPFFSAEFRTLIGKTLQAGQAKVILDNRVFEIIHNPRWPKYVFVNNTEGISPCACLDKAGLIRMAKSGVE